MPEERKPQQAYRDRKVESRHANTSPESSTMTLSTFNTATQDPSISAAWSQANAGWAAFWASLIGLSISVSIILFEITSKRKEAVRALQREVQLRHEALDREDSLRAEDQEQNARRASSKTNGWVREIAKVQDRTGKREELSNDFRSSGWNVETTVVNRSDIPMWNVVAQLVDPHSGMDLCTPSLMRDVLAPDEPWHPRWACGRAFFPYSESQNAPTRLPAPECIIRSDLSNPILRLTYEDASGHWERQGPLLRRSTKRWSRPEADLCLSRASENLQQGTPTASHARREFLTGQLHGALLGAARDRFQPLATHLLSMGDIAPLLTARQNMGRLEILRDMGVQGINSDAIRTIAGGFDELAHSLSVWLDYDAANVAPSENADQNYGDLLFMQSCALITAVRAVNIIDPTDLGNL